MTKSFTCLNRVMKRFVNWLIKRKLINDAPALQVEMAHKVLSSDMAQLIEAMRLAQSYSTTLMDNEYRRGMLKAAHVLAMDSKNLLDSVDNARRLTESTSSEPLQHSRTNSSASVEGACKIDPALEALPQDFAASVTLDPSSSPSPEPDSNGTQNSREDTYSRVFEESINESSPVTDDDSNC